MIIMWARYGLVASSSHRQKVLAGLRGGPKGTSALARDLGMRPPHVSKALKELEEAGLVKCLTPGQRKGVLYSLTKTGEEASSHGVLARMLGTRELLEHGVAKALDEGGIPYARNVSLRGERFEVWPDFVIPSGTAPKVIVEVKSFASAGPETVERVRGSAFAAADLKREIKGVKAVLVVGNISRRDLPEISGLTGPEYFDAVFFEGEFRAFSEYVKKHI